MPMAIPIGQLFEISKSMLNMMANTHFWLSGSMAAWIYPKMMPNRHTVVKTTNIWTLLTIS
jgi:hypothetical protein